MAFNNWKEVIAMSMHAEMGAIKFSWPNDQLENQAHFEALWNLLRRKGLITNEEINRSLTEARKVMETQVKGNPIKN